MTGYFAELSTRDALAPLFERVRTQIRVEDKGTIVDATGEGAKRPIAISGAGSVPEGGSLAVEVKAGQYNYFLSEFRGGHLLKQVDGHTKADASLVLATRDVKDAFRDLPRSDRDAVRKELKDAGSQLFCVLPHKADLDRAVFRLLEVPSRTMS